MATMYDPLFLSGSYMHPFTNCCLYCAGGENFGKNFQESVRFAP